MAEAVPTPGAMARQHGFTLAEMLAALAILLIGVTTLLYSLGSSVSLRRSTDARLAAAAAVEDVVLRVQQTGIRRRAGADTDLDLELVLPPEFAVETFPGMRCKVQVEEPKDRIDVWLLIVQASWLEAGEPMVEEFLRVIPRQLPLAARVRRFRDEQNDQPR